MHKIMRGSLTINPRVQRVGRSRKMLQVIEMQGFLNKTQGGVDRLDERGNACLENLRTFVHKVIHRFISVEFRL
jgi:ribosomal protein S19E (S16A)